MVDRMNTVLKYAVIFLAICLFFLGFIFLIAGGEIENYLTGGIMIAVAFGLLGYIYMDSRLQARRPIQQDFHVTMGVSGQVVQKEINCRSCGAPLKEENLTVAKGAVIVKCPYCGSVYSLEEEPKW